MLKATYLSRQTITYHVNLMGLVLVLSIGIAGCTKPNNPVQATKQWVANAAPTTTAAIVPVPTVPHPITSTYRFNPDQDPFGLTKSSAIENTQTPSTLTAYPLSTYTMVGTLMQGTRIWGLVSLPHGNVIKVTVGDFLGQEGGQISAITDTVITIIETNSINDSGQDKTITLNIKSE